MDERTVEIAFNIITYSGNARGIAVEAIEMAKEGNIKDAREHLEEARKEINNSHNYQTELITNEANGKPNELSVLLIHSQDHLMTSMVVIDMAEYFIDLFEDNQKLKEEMKIKQ